MITVEEILVDEVLVSTGSNIIGVSVPMDLLGNIVKHVCNM